MAHRSARHFGTASPKDHYLLERLFIDCATEREIAEELGISQPTVSRWKWEVLQKLQQMLGDWSREKGRRK